MLWIESDFRGDSIHRKRVSCEDLRSMLSNCSYWLIKGEYFYARNYILFGTIRRFEVIQLNLDIEKFAPITKSYNFIRSKQLGQMMKVSADTKSRSQEPEKRCSIHCNFITIIQYTFIDIKRCHRSLLFSTPKKYDDDDDEACIRILNFVSFMNFSSIYFSILTTIKRSLAIEEKMEKISDVDLVLMCWVLVLHVPSIQYPVSYALCITTTDFLIVIITKQNVQIVVIH